MTPPHQLGARLARSVRARSALAALVLAALLVGPLAPPSIALTGVATQDQTTTTMPPVREGDSPINDILPEPNSGTAPEKPSDRGGWQQIMVFGLLVGGMGVIVLLVRRESRAARRRAES